MCQEALGVLDAGSAARRLRDPLGVQEQRARLYLAMGRREDAEAASRRLVGINTENYKYHAGLQAALQLPATAAVGGEQPAGAAAEAGAAAAAAALTAEQRQRLTEVYGELQRDPHSVAMKRMTLDFLVIHILSCLLQLALHTRCG